MSTSQPELRVYNRRSKMQAQTPSPRDWAGLPSTLLEKVFESLEKSDLQSAKDTCRQWKEASHDQSSAQAPDMSSWTDSIDNILRNLHLLNDLEDADVEQIKEFLVQEGLMKAP